VREFYRKQAELPHCERNSLRHWSLVLSRESLAKQELSVDTKGGKGVGETSLLFRSGRSYVHLPGRAVIQ